MDATIISMGFKRWCDYDAWRVLRKAVWFLVGADRGWVRGVAIPVGTLIPLQR